MNLIVCVQSLEFVVSSIEFRSPNLYSKNVYSLSHLAVSYVSPKDFLGARDDSMAEYVLSMLEASGSVSSTRTKLGVLSTLTLLLHYSPLPPL